MTDEDRQVRMYDGYEVSFGEIIGGRSDGMESCCILLRHRKAKKRLSIAMPIEMAVDLAKDILEMFEEEEP